ncbi:MAG: alpha/beta hydrolase [Candidatus Solibacter usitatus]|nr:alpha/beta hydrolase [Candidatus Solibacter usitatus]
MKLQFAFLICTAACVAADTPTAIPLWPGGAPGSAPGSSQEQVRLSNGERIVSNVHSPSIIPFLPEKASGAAVVIAPGGGHREMWTDHEGHNIAQYLASRGVAGFVLKYRLAREKDSKYTIEGHALADTQRAIRVVRSRAAEWNIDPERVGVMGFSAGGELAALAAVRDAVMTESFSGAVDQLSSKPSFQVLVYPAIPKDMKLSKETPPAFLVCGENDRQNISQGLPELYLALKRAGASAELHVYSGTGHGFGMRETMKGAVAGWPARFYEWLDARGFLKKKN